MQEEIRLSAEIAQEAEKLAENKYRTWEWNFGKSPAYQVKFRRRFSFGAVDFYANVKHGKIDECRFYGDFFVNKDISMLEKALQGTLFRKENVLKVLKEADVADYFVGSQEQELADFFAENILV